MQEICKKYAKYAPKRCKKYARNMHNMQEICTICMKYPECAKNMKERSGS